MGDIEFARLRFSREVSVSGLTRRGQIWLEQHSIPSTIAPAAMADIQAAAVASGLVVEIDCGTKGIRTCTTFLDLVAAHRDMAKGTTW